MISTYDNQISFYYYFHSLYALHQNVIPGPLNNDLWNIGDFHNVNHLIEAFLFNFEDYSMDTQTTF